MKKQISALKKLWKRNDLGDALRPLLLWLLGVPGGIALLLWFFFFRGK